MTDHSEGPSGEDGSDVTDEPVRGQYDWSSIAPSTAVVEATASALGREATTFEPLFNTLDPDTLDALLRSSHSTSESATPVTVSFCFADRQVTVDSDGDVSVRELATDR